MSKKKTIKDEMVDRYLKRMEENIRNSDREEAHANADDLLCELLNELGFEVITGAFSRVGKWYA